MLCDDNYSCDALSSQQVNGEADLFTLIEDLRDDRVCMVQHDIQYELVHHACLRHAERTKHEVAYHHFYLYLPLSLPLRMSNFCGLFQAFY